MLMYVRRWTADVEVKPVMITHAATVTRRGFGEFGEVRNQLQSAAVHICTVCE